MVYDFCCKLYLWWMTLTLRLQLGSKHGPEFNLSSSVNQELRMGWNLPAFIPNYLTLTCSLSSFSPLSGANSPYLSKPLVFDHLFLHESPLHVMPFVSPFPPNYTVHVTPSLAFPPHLPPAIIHPRAQTEITFNHSHLSSSPSSLFFLHLASSPPLSTTPYSAPSLLPHPFFSRFFVHLNWKSGHRDTLLAKAPLTSHSACLSPINLSCKTHSVDNTQPALIFPAG